MPNSVGKDAVIEDFVQEFIYPGSAIAFFKTQQQQQTTVNLADHCARHQHSSITDTLDQASHPPLTLNVEVCLKPQRHITGGTHQGINHGVFRRRMSGLAHQKNLGFRPGSMQVIGVLHRTQDIVAAMDNNPRQLLNFGDVVDDLVVCQKTVIG